MQKSDMIGVLFGFVLYFDKLIIFPYILRFVITVRGEHHAYGSR